MSLYKRIHTESKVCVLAIRTSGTLFIYRVKGVCIGQYVQCTSFKSLYLALDHTLGTNPGSFCDG